MPEHADRCCKMCSTTKSTITLLVWWILDVFHEEVLCHRLGNISVLSWTYKDCI